MKIYTSEVPQFGRTILILNKEVTFDKIGCAEVEDSFGKDLINYSEWFTASKKEIVKENIKPLVDDMSESIIEGYKLEIDKLNKKDLYCYYDKLANKINN